MNMKKYLLIKNYYGGELLAKKPIPRAQGRSVTFHSEYMDHTSFIVVRDYYTGEVLHRFRKSWNCSIEFTVVEE